MAEGRRASAWKHTSALLFTLHKAHFKESGAKLEDFDPYAEADAVPETPVQMVGISALKDIFIHKKMPSL